MSIHQNEISVYSGELTTQCIIKNNAAIKKAFPGLPMDFFDVLIDRAKDNGFSDGRYIDSVKHVIDNCVYPMPTIAQFMSFDNKVKLYTYKEVGDYIDEGGSGDDFESIKINDKVLWVKVSERHLINKFAR